VLISSASFEGKWIEAGKSRFSEKRLPYYPKRDGVALRTSGSKGRRVTLRFEDKKN
jgi:hypothetical protein